MQIGFFDVTKRHKQLNNLNDPLLALSNLIDFEITRITVFPPTNSSRYRFQAVKDSNADIIDRDIRLHKGIWDIEKSYAINNDYVNVSIFNANTDGTYTVRLTFLDNFRP